MEVFADFIAQIADPENRKRTEEVLGWVSETFPELEPKIAWKQPMFTDHGTFIIGFSVSKHHLAAAPEKAGILRFTEDIVQAGYDHTKELVRLKWKDPVNYALLEKMIRFNIEDKADCTTFWR